MEGKRVALLGERGRVEHDFVHAIPNLSVPSEKCDVVSKANGIDAARCDVAAALFSEYAVNEAQSTVVWYRGQRCAVQQARSIALILVDVALPQAMFTRTVNLVTRCEVFLI